MTEPVADANPVGQDAPLFGFKARKRLDLGSSYDVTDSVGQPIGWFKRQFTASLVNSTWRLGLPDVYQVTLPALPDGKPIDWRVGMAMAVALDALQSR